MRWVSVAAVVLPGCGSATTRTVIRTIRTVNGPLSNATRGGSGGTYTSRVQLPLPFDPEENAFMGNTDPQDQGRDHTGCFAVLPNFDTKSEEVCDCAYRKLRAEGYPASQLAAVAASVNWTNNAGPKWFNLPIVACWADLDGSS
jgi:hypothetical protein